MSEAGDKPSFEHNPAHEIGTCSQCGGEMVYNVPRMGPGGGFVHKATGQYLCPEKDSFMEAARVVFENVPLERTPDGEYVPKTQKKEPETESNPTGQKERSLASTIFFIVRHPKLCFQLWRAVYQLKSMEKRVEDLRLKEHRLRCELGRRLIR